MRLWSLNTVAVIKNSEQSFNNFDANFSDLHGMPHSFGKCTLLTIEGTENLVSYDICKYPAYKYGLFLWN